MPARSKPRAPITRSAASASSSAGMSSGRCWPSPSSVSTWVKSRACAYSRPARNATAFPWLRGIRRHVAPALAASSYVPSVDPSSITTTSATYCAAPLATAAMWGASLYAGISAQTFILLRKPGTGFAPRNTLPVLASPTLPKRLPQVAHQVFRQLSRTALLDDPHQHGAAAGFIAPEYARAGDVGDRHIGRLLPPDAKHLPGNCARAAQFSGTLHDRIRLFLGTGHLHPSPQLALDLGADVLMKIVGHRFDEDASHLR